MALDQDAVKKVLETCCQNLGIDAWGVSTPPYDIEYTLLKWIRCGYHGKMSYLARNYSLRSNPAYFIPYTKRVISFAASYGIGIDSTGRFASYALGKDYHSRMSLALSRITRELKTNFGGKYFYLVDSFPIPEREAAVKAGLGWIGKSGNLIVPGVGPNVYLAEILTDLEIDNTLHNTDHHSCGDCRKCIDACPGKALTGDGTVDSTKCISYYSTEIREAPPEDLRREWNGRFFGCETCVAVCPHVKKRTSWDGDDSTPLPDDLFHELPHLGKSRWKGTVLERFSKKKLMYDYIMCVSSSLDKLSNPEIENAAGFIGEFRINLSFIRKTWPDDQQLLKLVNWAEDILFKISNRDFL
ncbi:DUF1730 domain-containing protein [Myxococcota bacterium]|nr:DUF1730 domain-containing protein [Myxococcota bacterium]MBU1379630.1 DUF1730 domain-containing protein [Myxococcota bacterium]MBU1498013.1 DUF1730 domain-containing protein [Myxococcota bacterium]